jgi:methionine aminopeptidase
VARAAPLATAVRQKTSGWLLGNRTYLARRQLAGLERGRVEDTLRALSAARRLAAYPPLVDADGRRIAQAEHTVYVGNDGVEVLTA